MLTDNIISTVFQPDKMERFFQNKLRQERLTSKDKAKN